MRIPKVVEMKKKNRPLITLAGHILKEKIQKNFFSSITRNNSNFVPDTWLLHTFITREGKIGQV